MLTPMPCVPVAALDLTESYVKLTAAQQLTKLEYFLMLDEPRAWVVTLELDGVEKMSDAEWIEW